MKEHHKDPVIFFGHILDAIDDILSYIKGVCTIMERGITMRRLDGLWGRIRCFSRLAQRRANGKNVLVKTSFYTACLSTTYPQILFDKQFKN